nr:hypothetical protein [uncultured Hyphomonas sp.]
MSDETHGNGAEFIDQQRELSGAGGAKETRFFDEGSTPRSRQEKERKERAKSQELNRLLDLINSDPAYATARQEFGDFLRDVEQVTEAALLEAQTAYQQANAALDDVMDNANHLPDGRAVFRDANGNVFTADGHKVSEEDAASIVWKDGAPSYEDYLAARREADKARERFEDIERYRHDVLGPARHRFDDEDDPMMPDEFDKHRKRIEETMPDAVKDVLVNKPREPQNDSITQIAKPKL